MPEAGYPLDDAPRKGPHAPRRLTMRDVAEAAGVSVALVSHAFSRPSRVAPTTRERILQTAAAMGYAGPDPTARALRVGHAARIGVAAPDGVAQLLADPAAVSVLRGLGRSCDRAGVSLVIASGFNEPMDAVAGIRARPEHVPPGVRAIAIDAPDGDPDGVRVDYAPAATALAEHLAGVGHRRAVIVSWAGAGPRLRALVEAWQRVGDARVLMAAGATYGHGDLAARAIQAAEPEATAVIALCDPLARGIVDAMRWSGRRVPHDISVASIDGLDGTDLAGLTAVLVPYEPLGELAGSLVLGADGVPPALPATLAIRQTTGPVAR